MARRRSQAGLKQATIARGLAKVPRDQIEVYDHAEALLIYAEERLAIEERTIHACDRSLWYDLMLELRDLASDLEHRYPVLRLRTRRPFDADHERN